MKMATKKEKVSKGPILDKETVDWRCREGFKPTRFFQVGEQIGYGNHNNVEILEVLKDGAIYLVKCFGTRQVYGKDTEYYQEQIVAWHNLFKKDTKGTSSFTKEESYRLHHTTRDIDGLISLVLSDYAGVNFTPDYQRDYVWTLEDKENLIESIFNNINIGHFVLGRYPYSRTGKLYEIIDGKQRLSTLVEFYEDRFPYKGVYFSQLSFKDSHHFTSYSTNLAIMEEPTEKQKLEVFVKVNTTGKVMDAQHLASVQTQLDNMD
jgi:hypothetical protein